MALVTTVGVVELLDLDLCGRGLMQRSPSWEVPVRNQV